MSTIDRDAVMRNNLNYLKGSEERFREIERQRRSHSKRKTTGEKICRHFRGVAIYVKDDLYVNEVKLNTDFKDHLWVEIRLSSNDSILCGCIYRSPTKEKEATLESTDQICEILAKASARNYAYLLICGDFNYRDIDWENESSNGNNEHCSSFLNTIQDCFLQQHVTEPTRYRHGEEPSLLDLVLSNEEGMVYNLAHEHGLGDSDYVTLTFDLICHKEYHEKLQPQPNFFKANYSRIRNKLAEINWVGTLSGNFEESYGLFIEYLTSAMEGNVPNRTSVTKKHNLYMNAEAIRLKNKKQKLWERYTFTRNSVDYEKFVRNKNHLRSFTRTLRRYFEINLAARSKKSPKQFWSYVRSKLKTRTSIPTLTNKNGSEASTSITVGKYEYHLRQFLKLGRRCIIVRGRN